MQLFVVNFISLQGDSTRFGCFPHPSSRVHKTESTAFGTGHIIVAATFFQRGQVWTPDDGCGKHPKHESDPAVKWNWLRTAASCWLIIIYLVVLPIEEEAVRALPLEAIKDARQETGFAKAVAFSATVRRQMNRAQGARGQLWPRLLAENSNTIAAHSFAAYNLKIRAEGGQQPSRMLTKEHIETYERKSILLRKKSWHADYVSQVRL